MENGTTRANVRQWFAPLLEALGGFMHWWSQELLGLLPAKWRSWFQLNGKQLLIEFEAQRCSIKSGSQSNPSPITSFELNAEKIIPGILVQQLSEMGRKADETVLLLASEGVLKKTISLPRATRNKLDDVLRFEMDRHTPFAIDQVYFDYRIQPGASASDRINVELFLVTRAWLDSLLQQLKEVGLSPSVVTPIEERAGSLPPAAKRLNLLKGYKDSSTRNNWRMFRIQKGLALLLLLIIGVGFALYERKQRVETLGAQLDEPRIMAQRAQQAREQIKLLKETRQFLTRKKAEEPVILYLMEELTRQLPDHTWLSRFEVQNETVKLQGESKAASDLIGIIEQSEHFHDARFSSPVTINPRTQKERFVITAAIGSGGKSP